MRMRPLVSANDLLMIFIGSRGDYVSVNRDRARGTAAHRGIRHFRPR